MLLWGEFEQRAPCHNGSAMGILHISRLACLPVGYTSNCLATEPCHLSVNIVRMYTLYANNVCMRNYGCIGLIIQGWGTDSQAVCCPIMLVSRIRHNLNVRVSTFGMK